MTRVFTVGIVLLGLLFAGQPAFADDEPEKVEEPKQAPTRAPARTVDVPDLPGVIVTGTPLTMSRARPADRNAGVPEVPLDSVGSRDVFGPKQVKETGARDLNELVRHLPAMSSRPYNGGEAAAPSFSMRGLPDDGLTEYVHILIDGVPASPLPYGWTAFSFLPITTERVYALDYLRGAHTVRYSPNTVGGILNFITAPIPQCPTFNGRVTLGTENYRSLFGSVGGTYGRWGFLATVVDRRGDGYRDNGAFEQQDFNLKLRYALGRKSWIAASLTAMDSDHKAPGGLTQAQFAADRFGNARPYNEFDGDREVADIVVHLDQGGCGDFIEAFGYVSRTWRNLRAQRPHFGAAATVTDWTDASWFVGVGARFQKTVRVAGCRHELYGGLRYLREWIPDWRLSSEPFPAGPGTLTQDATYETDTISAHIDDTFKPLPRLTVQAGLRLEWVPSTEGSDSIGGWSFDDDFFRVMPGLGASYELSPCTAVYANYYEGFRAPQVWGYASATGTGQLDYELGRSMEAGFRVKNWRGFSGSVAGWRTEYDDFGVFYTGFYENLGNIEAQGVDFIAAWDVGETLPGLRGLSCEGSLTLQDSEIRSGPNKGNETPYAWEQKATWRVRYERCGWLASLGGTYVGESFSDDANTVLENANGNLGVNPAVTLWDARLAKTRRFNRRSRLEVAVGVTNLFNEEWHVHSRGGFFGGGKVAGPPRQGYFSIDFNVDL